MSSTVSVARSHDSSREPIRGAVEGSLRLLGGMRRYVGRGATVLLKPNMCWGGSPIRVTTHPLITAAVVELCYEAGAEEVIVGEGAGAGADTEAVYEETGTRRLAEEAGAKVVDFKRGAFTEVTPRDTERFRRLRVASPVIDADTRINLPVAKIDCPTTFSCGLKNWVGILHDEDKVEALHRRGMPWCLADLHEAVAPSLVIADLLEPPEVFPGGVSHSFGLIASGGDPVAVDAVAGRILGVEPASIINTRVAAERGLGTMDAAKIACLGESLGSVARSLPLPPLTAEQLKAYPGFEGINVVNRGLCPGCLQSLLFTWRKKIKKRHLRGLQGKTIIIGPSENRLGGALTLGDCAGSPGGVHVRGCMPYSSDIVRGVRELVGDDDAQ